MAYVNPDPRYRIEVHNSSGTLLAILNQAHRVGYDEAYNELSTLSFNLPANDTKMTHLAYSNEVWLYIDDVLKDCYLLQYLADEDTEDKKLETTIESFQVGARLLDDYIVSYSKTVADGLTTSDILTALLAYQTSGSPITLGTVDAALDYVIPITIAVQNIWNACLAVQAITGGILTVECNPATPTTRTLNLRANIGEDKGQQVRKGKNMRGIKRETDYTNYATKLTPIGDSGLLLDSSKILLEAATKSSDASYGYLMLAARYACYKNWTALGGALPTGMEIFKAVTPAYVIASSLSGSGWTDRPYASDGNDATWADSTYIYDHAPLSIRATFAKTHYDKVKLRAKGSYSSGDKFTIVLTYHDSTTETIASNVSLSTSAANYIYNIANKQVQYVDVTFSTTNDQTLVSVYEIQCEKAYDNETSKFVQGADERYVRCAIADYDGSGTYYITYTHAQYLYNRATGQEIKLTKQYSASDLDTLRGLAQTELELMANPYSYSVNLVDISDKHPFEALQLGSNVTIVDEDLDIEIQARVVHINRKDLDDPAAMEIELSTRVKNLSDVILALKKAQ